MWPSSRLYSILLRQSFQWNFHNPNQHSSSTVKVGLSYHWLEHRTDVANPLSKQRLQIVSDRQRWTHHNAEGSDAIEVITKRRRHVLRTRTVTANMEWHKNAAENPKKIANRWNWCGEITTVDGQGEVYDVHSYDIQAYSPYKMAWNYAAVTPRVFSAAARGISHHNFVSSPYVIPGFCVG